MRKVGDNVDHKITRTGRIDDHHYVLVHELLPRRRQFLTVATPWRVELHEDCSASRHLVPIIGSHMRRIYAGEHAQGEGSEELEWSR